jgi:protein-disulfide isomerase
MRKLWFLFILAAACGASGQAASSSQPQQSVPMPLSRKIALMVRSQFSVPSDCDITVESRTPSNTTGFDTLHVTIRRGAESTAIDFLISTDNQTLARVEKFDLNGNPSLSIDLTNRPIRGNPDAPVTIVSFDDLECPVCARMHQILVHDTLPRYANEIRVVYKDNPLLDIHPWALHAAVDANCLADQSTDAYWSYVDFIHAHGQEVSGESRDLAKSYFALDRIAGREGTKANLDPNSLMACLKIQDQTPVLQSMKEASRLGLNFAPALFVNGEEVRGLASEIDLSKVIDRALHDAGVVPAESKQNAAPAPPRQ